jgi:hypothetical protein
MSHHVGCPACGRPLEPAARFCGTCGTPVASWAPQSAPPPAAPPAPDGARTGLIVGLVAACVLAAGGLVAVILLATGGNDGGSPPAAALTATPAAATTTVVAEAEPEERPATPSRTTYDRGAYAIRLPRSWSVRSRGEDKGSYVESIWTSPASADVTLLVDHTPGYTDSPEDGARTVRSMTSRSAGYREIGFGPTQLAGRAAWRWEFTLDGKRKVDWFVTACGTGYAVLGTAPSGTFGVHADTFAAAAASLEPSCGG